MALNILIVDDSQIVRSVIAKSLDLANVPVRALHQAGNGAEALKILVSCPVDLVFADINMPVMGGVELVERMSRDDHLWSIPVVIVSTEGSSTRVEELKSKGVRAYLRKPFKPESIRAVIDEVVGVPNANG
jgi:two-component system chemotaxis response regulator CheY